LSSVSPFQFQESFFCSGQVFGLNAWGQYR